MKKIFILFIGLLLCSFVFAEQVTDGSNTLGVVQSGTSGIVTDGSNTLTLAASDTGGTTTDGSNTIRVIPPYKSSVVITSVGGAGGGITQQYNPPLQIQGITQTATGGTQAGAFSQGMTTFIAVFVSLSIIGLIILVIFLLRRRKKKDRDDDEDDDSKDNYAFVLLLLGLVIFSSNATALGTNDYTLNLQYTTPSGLFTGTQSIKFSFYDANNAGTLMTNKSVDVTFYNGIGTAVIPDVSNVNFKNDVWIEVQFPGQPPSSPRLKMTKAPDSFNNPFNYETGKAYLKDDSILLGIGTQFPSSKLHVGGNISATGAIYSAGSQVCTAANGLCGSGNGSYWTNNSGVITLDNSAKVNGNFTVNGTAFFNSIQIPGMTICTVENGFCTGNITGGNSSWNQSYASTLFLSIGGVAADSNLLGGFPSSYYLNTSINYATVSYVNSLVGSFGNVSGSNNTLIDASECGDLSCNTYIEVETV